MDEKFKKNVEYKEYNIKELEDYIFCIWTMESRNTLNEPLFNKILPDACIDIVIDFSTRSISFSGFSKNTENLKLSKNIDFMGVRMKPGTFILVFDIPDNKIMDNGKPFRYIDKDSDFGRVLTIKNCFERIEFFKNYLIEKTKNKKPTLFMSIIDELYRNPNEQKVMDIAKNFGYNERHLYRMFKTNYGVSPKVLLNILRLHLCLTMMQEENASLLEIANRCGFYDQAHFIKEIKKYTGISPLKIIDNYK